MTTRHARHDGPGSEHAPSGGYGLGGAYDLGSGAVGTALHAVVTARDHGTWTRADEILHTLSRHPVDPEAGGLFHGAPALAYVLHTAGDHPPYLAERERLDAVTDDLTRARLRGATQRMDSGCPPRHREFDLISGLTGLGALLLHTGRSPELLAEILAYLVRLLDVPVMVDGAELPGWWSTDTPRGEPDPGGGHANFGLAHGVAGPVALLALGARAGHEIPGARECLRRACGLLLRWADNPDDTGTTAGRRPGASVGDDGIGWPETVDTTAWADPARAVPSGRPSWCYGVPGIARALQLAAITCGYDSGRIVAEYALAGYATSAHLARLGSGVCHGRSGLRLALARARTDAASIGLLHGLHLPPLTGLDDGRSRGAPGLLTGDDGIRLVGRTLQPNLPPPPRWDTCLLLDGPTGPPRLSAESAAI